MSEHTHKCATCELREHCRHTFGEFYDVKSAGGVGCNHKIAPFDLADVKRQNAAARAADEIDAQDHARITAYGASVDAAGSSTWHKYVVTHNGREHATAARSVAEAVNAVRWKLYGKTPLDQLAPFVARVANGDGGAADQKPSKSDILERIIRMQKGNQTK